MEYTPEDLEKDIQQLEEINKEFSIFLMVTLNRLDKFKEKFITNKNLDVDLIPGMSTMKYLKVRDQLTPEQLKRTEEAVKVFDRITLNKTKQLDYILNSKS